MNILILSLYFKPDLCAGSFRCTALVEQLKKMAPQCSIKVITSKPSRYSSYDVATSTKETQDNVCIQRITLPAHQSNMIKQVLGYLRFVQQAIRLTKSDQYDLVFATSSRMMTAVLGTYIAFRKKAKLYLDIRDIFINTCEYIFPKNISFFTKPILAVLEKWSFNRADKINIVSPEFKAYFKRRYSNKALSIFTNGVDDEFIQIAQANKPPATQNHNKLTVVYAGNIGEGQGLHRIIPQLAKRLENKVHFKIIGDGGRKNQLMSELIAFNCTNVELLSPISRNSLIHEYQNADILFMHLNDYKVFEDVLPSKLFEYAASGKPIWAGLAGYSAEFTINEIENASLFAPCDADDAERAFSRIKIACTQRSQFIEKYSRKKIMQDMSADLLSLIKS